MTGRQKISTIRRQSRVGILVWGLFFVLGNCGFALAQALPLSPREARVRIYLRQNFNKAVQNKNETEKLFRYFRYQYPGNPDDFPATIKAYYAALEGLEGKFARVPTTMFRQLNLCLKYLDQSVKQKDADVETFFLRFSSLHHMPPVLGIPAKRSEDIATICRLLSTKDYSHVEKSFQLTIIDFMLKSRRLTREQIQDLEGLKEPLAKAQSSNY